MNSNNKVAALVFPNPNALGFCQIVLLEDVTNAFYQFVNNNGKLCLSGFLPSKDNFIDIQVLENGMYFLRLTYQFRNETLPFSVQR
jgi:hypothetical protein